jgi:ADP-heptose:LPS heptosyltransferase
MIANLDLVISVDTAVVHVAGAINKPVWVFVPWIPEWRWMLEREDTPWYPKARLFREPSRRQWPSVVGRVKDELKKLSEVRLSGRGC